MQVNDGKPRLISHSNQEPQSQSVGFPLSGNNTFCLLILKNYFTDCMAINRSIKLRKNRIEGPVAIFWWTSPNP
jgi:hypothetical protein